MTELYRRSVTFLLIAGLASKRQIRDAIRSAARTRNDVFDLQRNITLAAIGAPAAPLLQQILANLVACKLALLIFNTPDFRIFDQLSVELDQFHRNAAQRISPAQPLSPCLNVIDATLERWRQ